MDFPDFKREQIALEKVFKHLPTWAGNAALNFFKDSWRRQGFIDQRFERWPKRRNDRNGAGRAILISSGSLRRSLRLSTGDTWFEIGTDIPYAKAHNEGATIEQIVTPRQRRYFWAMHAKARRTGDTAAADTWRAFALSKKLTIKMPKRQFMGRSRLLERRIGLHVERAITAALGRGELK